MIYEIEAGRQWCNFKYICCVQINGSEEVVVYFNGMQKSVRFKGEDLDNFLNCWEAYIKATEQLQSKLDRIAEQNKKLKEYIEDCAGEAVYLWRIESISEQIEKIIED